MHRLRTMRVFITSGSEVQGPIEKQLEGMEQFHFAPKLYGFLQQAFGPQVLPEEFFGHRHSPKEMTEGDALPGTSRTQADITLFDFGLSPANQPVGEIVEDFASPSVHFIRWNFMHQ